MQQQITETERKVIQILVQHEPTASPYSAPIHAVDRTMGWETAVTNVFVEDLRSRNLIHLVGVARDGRQYYSEAYWKEGSRR